MASSNQSVSVRNIIADVMKRVGNGHRSKRHTGGLIYIDPSNMNQIKRSNRYFRCKAFQATC